MPVLPRYSIRPPAQSLQAWPWPHAGVVDAAVAAAAAAPEWSQQSPLRRARIMFQFRELLEAKRDGRACAGDTREHGKVLA